MDTTLRGIQALDPVLNMTNSSATLPQQARAVQRVANSTTYDLTAFYDRAPEHENLTCVVDGVAALHNILARALLFEAATFAFTHALRALDVVLDGLQKSHLIPHNGTSPIKDLRFDINSTPDDDSDACRHPVIRALGLVLTSATRRAVHLAARK